MSPESAPSTTDLLQRVSHAAREAGAYIMDHLGNIQNLDYKGDVRNVVTDVDRHCEETIRATLSDLLPNSAILGEEFGQTGQTDSHLWMIDPLDGTTNFLHGFPHFCVSIALYINQVAELGVIYNPALNELFTAVRGQGTCLNGHPVTVSDQRDMAHCLIASGFAYSMRQTPDRCLGQIKQVLNQCQGFRRSGSAALDLAYVACGRLDAYWEHDLNAWDVGAGAILVSEAGGTITGFTGQPFDPFSGQVLATNGNIHTPMQALLNA